MHWAGPTGPMGPNEAGLGRQKKNQFIRWGEFGFLGQTRESHIIINLIN